MRFLSFIGLILVLAAPAFACPPHVLIDPSQIRIAGDRVLIVTHATSFHDARYASKRGVDEAVRYAKRQGIPVIYLQDDTPEEYYFAADCHPDYWVYSQGGELRFPVTASHVYVVGGHLEMCLSATTSDLIYQWARQEPKSRVLSYFMDGIYSNGKLVDASDSFYGDFQKFMGVITYGRPGGEHWPKLTLLETMGVIIREEHEFLYVQQALPRWDRTFPGNYRIELQMNDSVKKVLRPADGWKPPTILFHFVDSAIDPGPPLPKTW